MGGRWLPPDYTCRRWHGDPHRRPDGDRRSGGTLELLVSSLPARALDLSPDRSELVRACAALGSPPHHPMAATRTDRSLPSVRSFRSRPVHCLRTVCADVRRGSGNLCLDAGRPGPDAVLVAGANDLWVDSPCVACGGCVDACPTAAIVEPGLADPRPIQSVTRTTCGYCGVGCSLDVQIRDGTVAAVTPALDGPVNRGHACVKGRFAHGFVDPPTGSPPRWCAATGAWNRRAGRRRSG